MYGNVQLSISHFKKLWKITHQADSLLLFVVVYSLSCVQLFCDLVDYSPPGSSVHGILQARILEWVGMSSFCSKNQVVRPSKKLLLIKEKQTSQVNKLSAFLYMGRCKNQGLGGVTSSRRTLAISRQYPNFSIPAPLRMHR